MNEIQYAFEVGDVYEDLDGHGLEFWQVEGKLIAGGDVYDTVYLWEPGEYGEMSVTVTLDGEEQDYDTWVMRHFYDTLYELSDEALGHVFAAQREAAEVAAKSLKGTRKDGTLEGEN